MFVLCLSRRRRSTLDSSTLEVHLHRYVDTDIHIQIAVDTHVATTMLTVVSRCSRYDTRRERSRHPVSLLSSIQTSGHTAPPKSNIIHRKPQIDTLGGIPSPDISVTRAIVCLLREERPNEPRQPLHPPLLSTRTLQHETYTLYPEVHTHIYLTRARVNSCFIQTASCGNSVCMDMYVGMNMDVVYGMYGWIPCEPLKQSPPGLFPLLLSASLSLF